MNLYFEQLNKTFLLQYLGNIIIIINGNKVLFEFVFVEEWKVVRDEHAKNEE